MLQLEFVTSAVLLFELEETEWLKALKVGEYVLRPQSRRPQALQEVLFSYAEAL